MDVAGDMSFSTAASLPASFGAACYCIHQLAALRANETVLIHAVAGEARQAAVQLAQDIGAEI